MAVVVGFRRARYGGSIRPAEWTAFGFAAYVLLNACPTLDDAANEFNTGVLTESLEFGFVRRIFAATAVLACGLLSGAMLALRRWVRERSRVASMASEIIFLGALCLWFWGPCMVARLELWSLLGQNFPGAPAGWTRWDWLVSAVLLAIANGIPNLTWGVAFAALFRSWRCDGRAGQRRTWLWTEWATAGLSILDMALILTLIGVTGVTGFGTRALVQDSALLAVVGLASWRISGWIGVGRDLPPPISAESLG